MAKAEKKFETKEIDVEKLQFDTLNPRYAPYHNVNTDSEVEIAKSLSVMADLKELVQSIAENGYINIEPLIATKSGHNYIILEGNRRLAAIKVLKDPAFAKKCGISGLPEIKAAVKKTLQAVRVTIVSSRDEARPLIGFKHINGPQKWDSFAKASFAKEWYESDKKTTLKEVARSIGDGHQTIKRLVFGLYVLEQAVKMNVFSMDDKSAQRGFSFSHLYTALTKPGFQDFLGIKESWLKDDPVANPVPRVKKAELGKVMLWLYGSKSDGIEPVIKSQNPDLGKLAKILEKATAKKVMLATNNLAVAYEEVNPPIVQFEAALIAANKYAEDAASKVSAFDGKDETLLEISNKLSKTTRVIFNTMQSIKQNPED